MALATDTTTATRTARTVLGPGGAISQKLAGYESRATQLAASELMERAIAEQGSAVVEAGTGTGKSLAYLVAALVSGKRAIISTADKSLQEQIWRKDIPFLQSVMPTSFSAAILKGRGNYVCVANVGKLREQTEGSMFGAEFKNPESVALWPDLSAWIDQQKHDGGDGDLEGFGRVLPIELHQQVTATSDECTGKKCPLYGECFAEGAKQRAKTADVVVVNHHLLLRDLELRASTGGMASMLPQAPIIVLDEAHEIEDIATGAFTTEIGAGRVLRLLSRLESLTVRHEGAKVEGSEERETAEQWQERMRLSAAEVGKLLETFNERLIQAESTAMRLGDETKLFRRPVAIWNRLAELMDTGAPHWLFEDDDRERWKKLSTQVGEFAVELDQMAYNEPDEGVVRYVEAEGEGEKRRVTICRAPIDVAPILRARLWNLQLRPVEDDQPGEPVSVIATSATLATNGNMGFWRSRVGTPRDARELVVGSPFDYQRNALLYIPSDGQAFDPSQSWGERAERYHRLMGDEMERLVRMSGGRAFLLFTSNRMLREVYGVLAPRLAGYQILRQGEQTRQDLVRRFKEQPSVLFGLKSFWTGVDVPGDALSLVVIDKMPFTPPGDPVFDARCELIQRRAMDRGVPFNRAKWAHFEELVIPNAIIAVKQGVGRLIRSQRDRGACVILDGRLVTKQYGPAVIRSLPPFARADSLKEVAEFFGGAA